MAGFWTDAGIEPKRQYRWLCHVGGMDPWLCKKVTKPKVTISETSHKFLNHTFYYPGRADWETVALTLADPVTPDTANVMFGKFLASGWNFPDNYSNSISTISKAKSTVGLGEVRILQLGANATSADEPNVIEQWTLVNGWIKDIAFGDLDYESENMVDITVTLRYDYAILEGFGGSARAAQQAQDGAPPPRPGQLPGA
tara:strand:- start:1312 stop:1908 length:597 start_codon:yes stop_codon:yes gene_type:complete